MSGHGRDAQSPEEPARTAPGKLRRQAASRPNAPREESFEGGEILHGKRNRGVKKSYVVDSSPDDEDDEEEAEIDNDEDEDEEMDAEGDDVMDMDAEGEEMDAEGEEDAEGDVDMSAGASPAGPTIKVSTSRAAKPPARGTALKVVQDEDDEDDDEELSDPGDSDMDDQTMGLGDDTMADEDAEGEEIEVAGEEDDEDEEEDAEGEEEPDATAGLDSDMDGSGEDTPNLDKMTKRQRARFEEGPGEFMKLSDGMYRQRLFYSMMC